MQILNNNILSDSNKNNEIDVKNMNIVGLSFTTCSSIYGRFLSPIETPDISVQCIVYNLLFSIATIINLE